MNIGKVKEIILQNRYGRIISRQLILTLRLINPAPFVNILKQIILSNKYGRLISRQVILTLRLFSPDQLVYKLISSNTAYQLFYKSKAANFLLSEHFNLTKKILASTEKFAHRTKNKKLLFQIAKIYKARREYDQAFNIVTNLLLAEKNEKKIIQYTIRAIQSERELEEKTLMELFEAGKLNLPDIANYFITCEYTLHSDNIIPDWDAIIACLEKDYNYALANFFILAALGHQKIEYIDKIKDYLIARKDEAHKLQFSRSVTIIAAAYYRSGEKEKLKQLDEAFDIDTPNWKIYMAFGQNRILEAMKHRGVAIKNTFFRFYPANNKPSNQYTLVPEKDICGEAFNALFYPAVYKSKGNYTVICDNRLHTILQRSFPKVNFIAKTPRYLQNSLPEKFDKLMGNLRDFLDNESFAHTIGANFFNIDYQALYELEDTRYGRKNGWLKTDDQLQSYWRNKLGNDKKLIGVSSNSTLRSKIRDIHMIAMENWGTIFNLPNCKFINLNASFTDESINEYMEKFNIEFINPDIDLFNDFDNLLAIMSILDFAIVPANNLMDFSSSVGINTIVFSPSNIMKTWTIKDDNYIFSEKVKFIFPREKENKIEKMVEEGTSHIKNTIDLSSTLSNETIQKSASA